jgi:hypothetical protein
MGTRTGQGPSTRDIFALASTGKLDRLLEVLGDAAPETIYYWLQVATDFGHDAADDMLVTLEEHQLDPEHAESLRCDLAAGYLTGDGLPVDFDKAAAYFESLEGDAALIERLRREIDPSLRARFDAAFPRSP